MLLPPVGEARGVLREAQAGHHELGRLRVLVLGLPVEPLPEGQQRVGRELVAPGQQLQNGGRERLQLAALAALTLRGFLKGSVDKHTEGPASTER